MDLRVTPFGRVYLELVERLRMTIVMSYACCRNYEFPISINIHQYLFITINYHQLPSITINYHQLLSITINYYQFPSISINLHQFYQCEHRIINYVKIICINPFRYKRFSFVIFNLFNSQ